MIFRTCIERLRMPPLVVRNFSCRRQNHLSRGEMYTESVSHSQTGRNDKRQMRQTRVDPNGTKLQQNRQNSFFRNNKTLREKFYSVQASVMNYDKK